MAVIKLETLHKLKCLQARRNFISFSKMIEPNNTLTPFHTSYYKVLELFSKGVIKNLIVSIPPQHGKSTGSSFLLPSYMLGVNPSLKIGIGSYNQSFARKFNRSIQRLIDSQPYFDIFPKTTLSNAKVSGGYLRNADEFEIVDQIGGLKVVGRGGSLTGNPIDVMIMDDLYKDSMEGNSPVIRNQVIEWYTSVVRKRFHNLSQQLVVFTRWHENDLIGFLEENENVVECGSIEQIEEEIRKNPKIWIKINFEAIKESEPTPFDQREMGQALWEEKHSKEKHLADKALNEHEFNCMAQGRPFSKAGLLYSKGFKTYTDVPYNIIKKGNYTDTADMGKDKLCSICYDVVQLPDKKEIYITDVVYSPEQMEETELLVIDMLNRNNTRDCRIESNNGGRGFARNVDKQTPLANVSTFHQSANKESRILTNASGVMNSVLFPHDWAERFPDFHKDLTSFKKAFASNNHDDAADALTGCYEEEIVRGYSLFI